MNINVTEICGKRTVTRDDGEKIHKRLNENWDKEEGFDIDFNNLLVASVSFMDEAFGQIALQHTREDLQNKLRFINILEYDRALLNDILDSRLRQKNLGENGPSLEGDKRKTKGSSNQ